MAQAAVRSAISKQQTLRCDGLKFIKHISIQPPSGDFEAACEITLKRANVCNNCLFPSLSAPTHVAIGALERLNDPKALCYVAEQATTERTSMRRHLDFERYRN
eukprot:TRINITY_DN7973_c0_g1_i1.p3 TRINITY_DN7973_c0_g1~~TRINITY_DN7973_c0_g1_i1.p3  ORF type:complete len:104 (+),score=18.44 TRINITY_DN7973_c0_g1_i1:130-441(+)